MLAPQPELSRVKMRKNQRGRSGSEASVSGRYAWGRLGSNIDRWSESGRQQRRLGARSSLASREYLFDRDGEAKDSSAGLIRRCRQLSTMGLDNRATDRQSHAHPIGLGCIEGL